MDKKRETASPRILSIKWGRMEVETLGSGKDFKIWPGGGRSWDWNEHGTGHFSGIQQGDVEELLEHECKVIVLSKGMMRRLKISKSILTYLQKHDVETVVAETKKAVKLYNERVDRGELVGGLFHSTC